MTTAINIIDKTSSFINKINNKIDIILQNKKLELAYKIFENNKYLQHYIKSFYNDKYDDTFIDTNGFLNRGNYFDFSQIPSNLIEQLKIYMEQQHSLYYYGCDWFNGFVISTFDNIYIDNREQTIYNECNHKTVDYVDNRLDLFLNLELLQAQAGCYPDIVYVDYYGGYDKDYTAPKRFNFLRTGQEYNEDRLLWFIEKLIEVNHKKFDYYDDNFIIEQFTPEFIKKIHFNKSVEILDNSLDSDFELHIQYCIPVKMKAEQLKKLGIDTYYINTYNETVVNIDINIQDWLESELSKGHSFKELAA